MLTGPLELYRFLPLPRMSEVNPRRHYIILRRYHTDFWKLYLAHLTILSSVEFCTRVSETASKCHVDTSRLPSYRCDDVDGTRAVAVPADSCDVISHVIRTHHLLIFQGRIQDFG